MKKIKLFPLILLLCLVLSAAAPAAWALEDPDIPAAAAVLIDLDSGRVLYGLNMDQQRAPASLTKVMTVLLALEAIQNGQAGMDDRIVAQSDCRYLMDTDSSTAGIMPGTETSMRELLYCALIKSANEACNIIGSYLAGSIDAFVERMNAKAQELGCTNTHFVTTNGLSAEGHYSSAYDLAVITRAAMQYPDFMAMCNTLSYTPESAGVNNGETMYNTNALITDQSVYGSRYTYPYASGVKTGFTQAAGYCLISTAEKDGVRVLAVVLGCDGALNANIDEYRNFEASIDLYNWVFENFSYQTVLNTASILQRVPVEYAQDGAQASLHPQYSLAALVPNDLDPSRIQTAVTVYDERLTAPLAADTVLGEVTVSLDGYIFGTVRLVNTANIELARSEFMRQRLTDAVTNRTVITVAVVIGLLLLLYFILVIRYRAMRRKMLRQRREAEKRRRQQALQRQQQQNEQNYDWSGYDE